MTEIKTSRLFIRPLTLNDTAFVVELLNDPAFIKNIADRKVRTQEDAATYLKNGPLKMYDQYGFGLWVVEDNKTQKPAGLCGLIKRDYFEDIDVGFAFLPEFCGKGFATESSFAVIDYGKKQLGLTRLIAIVNPENQGSISVLKKCGFQFEKMVRLPSETSDIELYGLAL